MDNEKASPNDTQRNDDLAYTDLDSARYHEADALLDAALDLPIEEREAYIEAACGGDEALQRKVEVLLAFGEEDGDGGQRGETRKGWRGLLQQVVEDEQARYEGALAGRRFGPWLLDRELGRGGMGLVYLARHEETGKAAAVKLVPPALALPQLLKRFEAERRALAKLPHAGIAGLLDGGVAEDGTPFFAMEYADGESITAYCARHRLGLQERVRLFLRVCEAVQAAHQRLVVHRDLKPSNVFVVEEGGRPLVKLLDFGIAKVLAADDEEGDAGLPVTATGERLLTPAYASPEQVTGGAVTTATDVYALGVLFFELVTGQRPYRVEMEGPRALIAVAEADVVRPSTAVARTNRSSDDARDREENRNAGGGLIGLPEPRRLVQRLRGDLDAICLKALRKEAEERYPTAQALSDDLERYLAERPVLARRGSSGYRAAKYIRRHRFALGTGLAVTLALLAGLGAALWQARMAAAEAEQRRLQAERAEATTAFVLGLFDRVSPEVAQGEAVSALELVEGGQEQIDQLRGQPLVQASVMAMMGRLYHSLGTYAAADSLHAQALALRQAHLDPGHPDVAESLYDRAEALFMLRDFTRADSLHGAALALREAVLPPDDPRLLESLSGVASGRYNFRDYAAADSLYGLVLERWAGPDWAGHPARARALAGRADVLMELGDPAGAEQLYQEALPILQATRGPHHPEVADVWYMLGEALGAQGHYDEAIAALRTAYALYRRLYSDAHDAIASSLYSIARLLHRDGQAGEAEAAYREAAALYAEALEADHPWSAYPLVQLGRLLLEQGRPSDALGALNEAEAIYAGAGLDRPDYRVAQLDHLTGRALRDLGRYDEAAEALRASRDAYSESHAYSKENGNASRAARFAQVLGEIDADLRGIDDLKADPNRAAR